MKQRASSKGRKVKISSLSALLAVVVVISFVLVLAVPGVSGQDVQPSPSPTPSPPPPGVPQAPVQGDAPPVQTEPASVTTMEDALQSSDPARVLETLYVPASGDTISSETSLAVGTTYTIRVTGMYVWGSCDPFHCPGGGPEYLRWGDAEYLTDDHWHGFSDPYWLGFIYLKVNGQNWQFGSYDPGHLYARQFVGEGAQVTFRVEDCSYCYPDNSGALRVEILEGTGGAAFDLGVVPFQQCGLPSMWAQWGNDSYGEPQTADPDADTICRWGCNLTAWAMLVDHWGFGQNYHTNPRELNQWLRGEGGYNGLLVDPRRVRNYARDETGEVFVYSGKRPFNPDKLHDLLAEGIPVILTVDRNGTHFVVATGETTSDGSRTWYLNDPGGLDADLFTDSLTTLRARYGDQASWMEWLWLPAGPANLASLTIALGSPGELLITDPQGRRTGLDPRRGIAFNEIPDAYYGTQEIADANGQTTPALRVFDLSEPLEGSYNIQIIGTGSGPYNLDIVNYDRLGEPTSATLSGEIQADSVDAYRLDYSSDPGAGVETTMVDITPVDIKPGSCPNPLKTKAKGVLPVAILGTDDLDVTQISPDSVHLAGVAPLRWDFEDVATPFDPFTGRVDRDDCTVLPEDGYLDLTLKYNAQEILDALGDVSDRQVLVLQLTGNLKDGLGGTPFIGEDVLLIIE